MSAGVDLRRRWRAASLADALDEVAERLQDCAVSVSEEIHLMSLADAGLRDLEQQVLALARRRLDGRT